MNPKYIGFDIDRKPEELKRDAKTIEQHRASRLHRDTGHRLRPQDCGVILATCVLCSPHAPNLPILQHHSDESLFSAGY